MARINIDAESFSKLSLEDRAKFVVKNHFRGTKSFYKGPLKFMSDTMKYIEINGYMEVVRGTPKSGGVVYRITEKGKEFISNQLPNI